MLQIHYANLRSTDTFHSIFEDAQRTGINDLVKVPALPPRRRAPRRYDDGVAAYQWEDPEEYYRSQFFEVINLLTSELTRRFDQPTLRLLKNIENVVLTAVNSSPGCISIRKNVVDMYTANVDMERLFTQLSMFPAVLQAHNSSAETPISRVTMVSTIVYILATQGAERHLNNLLFLHIHKDLTDNLNLQKVLRSFCFANKRQLTYFAKV
ncbi:hypothetical protein SKAU_G00138920 [Synaphobranchus kaupii]|uniref:Uncharacterized protein n=1 Tax=Synaphobranchus kaupii TaxID=118154 RepID=A0A9Q1J3T0_SYNKA|nr:hypothetical protein SKAU_G00138920 [Synaphobranchus kaupii]